MQIEKLCDDLVDYVWNKTSNHIVLMLELKQNLKQSMAYQLPVTLEIEEPALDFVIVLDSFYIDYQNKTCTLNYQGNEYFRFHINAIEGFYPVVKRIKDGEPVVQSLNIFVTGKDFSSSIFRSFRPKV